MAEDKKDIIQPIDGTLDDVAGRLMGVDPKATPEIPKARYGGILAIGEVQIPCYVLDDGRRVIHQRGMVKSLGMARGGSSRGGGDRLAYFVAQKTLLPFVSSELLKGTKEPLVFRTDRSSTAYGHDGDVQ